MRLAVALCLCTVTLAAAAVPTAQALPDDKAFAIIVLPDVKATLRRIEQISEMFKPGSLPPGQLAAQVGAAFGDPKLDNLDNLAGRPVILVIAPGSPTPSFAAILPVKDVARYTDAADAAGLASDSLAGLAIIGKVPADAGMGKRIADSYAAIAATKVDADLRIVFAPDRLVTAYGAFITMMSQMAVNQAKTQPNGAMIAKILPLELAGLLAVMADTASVQTDISLGGLGGVVGALSVDSVVTAKAGGQLAKALVAPPAAPSAGAATRLPAGSGAAMTAVGQVNMPALGAYLESLLTTLQAKPEGKELLTPEMVKLVSEGFRAWRGDVAMRMQLAPKMGMSAEFVAGMSDPAKAQALVQRWFDLFAGDSAIGTMYRDMGMTMVLTKDARQSGGASVSHLSYELDPAKFPPAQLAQMQAMLQPIDLAFTKDLYVASNDPAGLDAILAAKPGAPLTTAAEGRIGKGRDGYVDLDVLALARRIAAQAGKPMPEAKDAEPMTAAWTAADGRARIEYKVPLNAFAEWSRAGEPGVSTEPAPGF